MMNLYYCYLGTPLGQMCAVAHDQAVLFLKFCENKDEQKSILNKIFSGDLIQQKNSILDLLEDELNRYFQGTLQQFSTPIDTKLGTYFQKTTWQAVQSIGYGVTISYKQIAGAMQQEKASRAVGNANGANNILILVPCHRVIQADGSLGGYTAGIDRKKWLLEHEQSFLHEHKIR